MRPREFLASETVFLVATAVAAACALAFARLGFLGLALLALVALFVASRVEMDADAVGPMSPGPMPADLRRLLRDESGENAGPRRRAERARLARSLRFVKRAAGPLLLVGAVGFFTVQLG